MGRIGRAYEGRFRALLERVGARRLDQGVRWLVERAGRMSATEGVSLTAALGQVHEQLRSKPAFRKLNSAGGQVVFFCDAGLGGLARWLRAAGYEALWVSGIDDGELVREAQKLSATILTTDSLLMERRLLRDRIVPGLWLPPTLTIPEQLALVFAEFGLKILEPRCMSCGGELKHADKEQVRDRIPPKTYLWLDEYFLCERCGKLFWRGTHSERIRRQMGEVRGSNGLVD